MKASILISVAFWLAIVAVFLNVGACILTVTFAPPETSADGHLLWAIADAAVAFVLYHLEPPKPTGTE